MKKCFYYILLLVLSWNWIGCISEYDPGIEGMSDILVVEGIITNGTTVISLSRSVQLSESIADAERITNAQVSVESDSGNVTPSSSSSEGKYYIETGELDLNTAYRLKIVIQGSTYTSEFLNPMYTPPVDTVTFGKRGTGKPIQIQVNTTGTNESSRYYLWSFDEIWETRAHFTATASQADMYSPIIIYDPYSPYTFCWKYSSSSSILLGSTYKLTENKVINLAIAENDASSDRFTELYYLKIKQNTIRREAYNYYNNLKLNAESTGGVFGPTPSEMKGNIECVEDSSVPVIGYIEVSMTQYKEQFHNSAEFRGLYENPYASCPSFTSIYEAELRGYAVTLFEYSPEDGSLYAERKCIDCRIQGGTKLKPDFWPNNHI